MKPSCSPCTERNDEAKDFSIVMAFEAFRICLGLRPRNHSPEHVLLWMRCILENKS